jgi:imidazolonepropionase-like amidohydrolase
MRRSTKPSAVRLPPALPALLALALPAGACVRPPDSGARLPVTRYVNAYWLEGDRFVHGGRGVAGSRFIDDTSAPAARRVDLGGAWVVPAFGDAHTHNLDGDASTIAAYRREGVAYVQVLTNTPAGRERIASVLESPGAPKVAYANGGITSTYGHPMIAYEPRAMGIDWSEFRARRDEICASRLLEGKAYWFVDDEADLELRWDSILAGRPDVLKIFLLRAAEHPEEPACDDFGRIGLAPAVAREVVRRAHARGLRVWAHVETADDFALAVDIGVDGIAHLPGYAFRTVDPDEPRADYLIDRATAHRTGEADIVVTPTVSLISSYAREDSVLVREARAVQRENLARLIDGGVRIAIGSDWYGRTAWDEVEALASLGMFTPADLLTAWSVTTPRAIFPERRVGTLEPGAEATFLGLSCDPRERLECLREIELRVTEGIALETVAPPANAR